MGNRQPIAYEDVYSLKHLLNALKSSLNSLSDATYNDAANGYAALVHRMPADTLHPDERRCHPWQVDERKLYTDYPDHETAVSAIQNIWFDDRANAQRTFDFPGMIFCPPATLEQVDTVNHAKDDFKKRVLALKAKYRQLTDRDIEKELGERKGEWGALNSVKQALTKAGLARICIKQVYRKIPTIREPGLLRAKYYHNPKRPSRPRTVAEQLEIFHQKVKRGETTQNIINAIGVLSNMDPRQQITERQDSNDVITVNIKLPAPSANNGTKWSQVTGVLPIYCVGEPYCELQNLVDFNSLDIPFEERNSEKKKCVRKEQTTWSTTSFLPAFRLYLPAEPRR